MREGKTAEIEILIIVSASLVDTNPMSDIISYKLAKGY